MADWQEIGRRIAAVTGEPFNPRPPSPVGGGCINRTVRLEDARRRFFVKLNTASLLPMFEAEAAGLDELAAAKAIRVPRPVCSGIAGSDAYLVLEYLPFGSSGDAALAGEQLAALHRRGADRFGWQQDNTIGATPQSNRRHADWVDFWREERLGFQLRLAAENGHRGGLQRRGELLLGLFPALIDHRPVPSLLHGDLWGGNIGYLEDGTPVIFDPAVYYGDREADLAMTELFGGFGNRFYAAYQAAWSLDPGYRTRKTLYNLYHILNHLNLFGGGYGSQATGMIDRLLAELGH